MQYLTRRVTCIYSLTTLCDLVLCVTVDMCLWFYTISAHHCSSLVKSKGKLKARHKHVNVAIYTPLAGPRSAESMSARAVASCCMTRFLVKLPLDATVSANEWLYMKVHVHSTLSKEEKRKVIHTNTYLPFPNPYLAFQQTWYTNKHGQTEGTPGCPALRTGTVVFYG